ncbi:hypothetical protein [Priestia filamentosa]|nr:hypothetical protein [Priestia filamentosa]SMF36827.1 hypothetical protein SAMN06296056_1021158 [Priestia filamentosa]
MKIEKDGKELEVTERQYKIFYKPLGFKKKSARKRTTKSGE